MTFHFAPVQGHTDAAYRHFHNATYGTALRHYTPFIRLENGSLRPRDVKDLLSDLNEGIDLTPQIIFRDAEELNTLIAKLTELGAQRIDLNMGCPFPLQTGHGRGAATVANSALADAVVEAVNANPDIDFTVKMRLGMEKPDEWKPLLKRLNTISLDHITLHPRVARQQYGGEVDLGQFGEFLSASTNPVVYNGDIRTPADIDRIKGMYPGIAGIMIGRGLLGRPSLVTEYLQGAEWEQPRRLETMLAFHRNLMRHYASVLCGDSQVLSKIQPFWEYAEGETGRQAWKALRKAKNMPKYHSALSTL